MKFYTKIDTEHWEPRDDDTRVIVCDDDDCVIGDIDCDAYFWATEDCGLSIYELERIVHYINHHKELFNAGKSN